MKESDYSASALSGLGTSGLRRSGGHGGRIYEEFLVSLQGRRGIQALTEMLNNSSAVGAVEYMIRTLVSQATWMIEPADETVDALKWKEFAESCVEDMDTGWDALLNESLTHLGYGWACLEMTLKIRKGPDGDDPTTRSAYDDGLYGWRRFMLLGQDTLDGWRWDEHGDLEAMVQRDYLSGTGAAGEAVIPAWKLMHLINNQTKGSPEGRSLYRNAYVDWYHLKKIEVLEAIGIERDLAGLPVMWLPQEILMASAGTPEATIKASLEQSMARLKNDEQGYLLMPLIYGPDGEKKFDFELAATPGSKQFDTNAVLNRKRSNILQTCLAQFLMLGQQQASGGSYSLASSSTHLSSLAIGSILDRIAECFTRQAIGLLMRLNKVPRALWPRLTHGDVETPPLDDLARYVSAMAGAGVDVSAPAVQRRLLDLGGLPAGDVDDHDHDHGEADTEDAE